MKKSLVVAGSVALFVLSLFVVRHAMAGGVTLVNNGRDPISAGIYAGGTRTAIVNAGPGQSKNDFSAALKAITRIVVMNEGAITDGTSRVLLDYSVQAPLIQKDLTVTRGPDGKVNVVEKNAW